jgi:hypothetical protein
MGMKGADEAAGRDALREEEGNGYRPGKDRFKALPTP